MSVKSFGTQLQVGDAATPEVFTAISEIRDLAITGRARRMFETTHHQSPGGIEQYVAGTLDGGEISGEINWDPAQATHITLKSLEESGAVRNFKLVLPDVGATELSYPCIVSTFDRSSPVSGKLTGNITLKVAGQ